MQQRPSIAGVVILCLFGLPFAGMGLALAINSVRAQANGTPGSLVGIVIGITFVFVGLGLIAAGIASYQIANQRAARQAANFEKPWLWKQDWAAGRANGNSARVNITLWVFAVLWDVIAFTVAGGTLPKLISQHDLHALLVLIFPLAGVVFTIYAVRGTLRTVRFGRSAFWFDSATFSPGSRIKGAIHLKLPTDVPHGFDLTLSCKRRIVTGSGKDQNTQEMVLWQEKKNVSAQAIMRGPLDAQVPVEFTLSSDAYVTDEDNYRDRVFWQLHAKADVPGVDFSDNYELPVFRTPASQSQASEASEQASDMTQPISRQFDEQDLRAPAGTRIQYGEASGPGFYLPAMRNPVQALSMFVVAAIWSAIVYELWHAHGPLLFRIVFSLSELLVVYLFATVFFGTALLRVHEGALEMKNAILGMGALHRIPREQVASIAPLSEGQAVFGKMMCGIVVQSKDGREVKIARNSLSEGEAKWIVAQLEQALGLQRDTRTQFRSFYGAPPQPGRASRL